MPHGGAVYLSVLKVSSKLMSAGLRAATMAVLEFPPATERYSLLFLKLLEVNKICKKYIQVFLETTGIDILLQWKSNLKSLFALT